MTATTLSSDEFEKDPQHAIEATANGPVFISEDGIHAFALLTIEEYRRIGGGAESILDLLAMPGVGDIEFEPPRMGGELFRPDDFSE